jgi:hypothetical protein
MRLALWLEASISQYNASSVGFVSDSVHLDWAATCCLEIDIWESWYPVWCYWNGGTCNRWGLVEDNEVMGTPTLEGINVVSLTQWLNSYKNRLLQSETIPCIGPFCMWLFLFLLLCHAVTQSGTLCFSGTGVWTQDLMLAQQVLYC